jgi:hypothetical protein
LPGTTWRTLECAAALLVFFAAAAGAGIVPPGFDVRLVREAIASGPEGTKGTRPAFGIVDSFLVRTAEDAIGKSSVGDVMFLQIVDDLRIDGFILANIAGRNGPLAESGGFLLRLRKNRDDQLGRLAVVRPVGSDGRERIFRFGGTHAGKCIRVRRARPADAWAKCWQGFWGKA